MRVGNKEFHEMRNQFEKDVEKNLYGCRLDRDKRGGKTPSSVFYQDGATNQMFQAYMMGYENAKCLVRMD